ncbi:MAG: DUF3347 domain-containing protein [Bacteroidetes bacterium]|nr:DUF3347 domain-containing protein [Bacteroidota bacterium]
MRHLYLIFFVASLSIISCNSNTNNNTKNTSDTSAAKAIPATAPTSKLNEAGTQKLTTMLADYYGLKNAMLSLDATKADSFAKKLNASTADMQAYAAKDTASRQISPYLDSMNTGLQQIAAIKDPSCKRQQVPFSKVSDQLFAILKKTELRNANIYLQHCPMALEEKGAHWLSNETEIKNPYFPKTMIDCGDLEDSLK